jgi:photosystem II stability/assembly factor-like uncharacterized protein
MTPTSLQATLPSRAFLAGTQHGIALAHRADEWLVHQTLSGRRVRCLALDDGAIYAGTHGDGVLRSDDGGCSWMSSGLAGTVVSALAVAPSEPGTIYAGTKPARLFVSHDGAASWRELRAFRHIRGRWMWASPAERPYIAYVQAIAVAPTDPRLLLAGIEFGAVIRSADGGESFSGHRRRATRDCHALTFHARDGRFAYEAGGLGAALSTDGGQSWTRPTDGLDRRYCWAVAADPAQPDLWYISAAPGPIKAHRGHDAQAFIFRSRGGGPWQKLAGGLPQPLASMPYALITPHPDELYAALANGDIWHSTDTGDSWIRLPARLNHDRGAIVSLAQHEPSNR